MLNIQAIVYNSTLYAAWRTLHGAAIGILVVAAATMVLMCTHQARAQVASAAPADLQREALTPIQRQQLIQRIEDYLNDLTTIESEFIQIAPDGSTAKGVFYLQRPGRMRWEYAPPVPVLMVTQGKFLTFYDYELDQLTHIPLDDTLAGLLTQERIRFDARLKIIELRATPGAVRMSVQRSNAPEEGTLTLELSDQPLLLRNLIITDATGQTTHVTLTQSRFGVTLDPALFIFRDPRLGRHRRY